MIKRISLKNLNYVAASLGLLLSLGSIHAVDWEADKFGIFRPKGNADEMFIPAYFGLQERKPREGPIAIIKLLDIPIGASTDVLTYQSLQYPIQLQLQQLGTINAGNCFTRRVSIAYVVHRNSRFDTNAWRLNIDDIQDDTAVAIKFIPLTAGQISFCRSADQRDGGIFVQSLPNGFVLRMFPCPFWGDFNDWWEVVAVNHDPGNEFTFATIIIPQNGDITIIVEIVPPLRLAADNSGTFEALFEKASHPDCSCFTPFEFDPATAPVAFRRAVEDGNTVALRRLLANADDAQRDALLRMDFQNGCTPLYIAASDGKDDVVRLLVERGANVNAKISGGHGRRIPLHAAASGDHLGVAQALLDPEHVTPEQIAAQLNARAIDNRTALHEAALMWYIDIVRLLLAKGADVKAVTSDGDGSRTALHIAIGRLGASPEPIKGIVEALLAVPEEQQRRDQVMVRDINGRTALHIAAMRCLTDVVKLLLANGAEVDAQDAKGWTPLHFTVCRLGTLRSVPATIEAAAASTRALLEKFENEEAIRATLVNETFKNNHAEAKDIRGNVRIWQTEVQRAENKWYRRLLRIVNVDMDDILRELDPFP